MGTTWSVRVVMDAARPDADLPQGLQRQLDAVVGEMSHWEADSNLGRFNRAPAGSWHVLPPAFFDVLAYALEVRLASGGACDPCAGALVNLWGFGPHNRYDQPGFTPPAAAAIAAARAQVPVLLERDGRRAFQPGGVQLDLSAVAKGYGVDRLSHYLKAQGLPHHLVEVGGELRGAGMKPDGQPWWTLLEQVPGAQLPEMALALHGLSVATSGDYRRYFFQDGRRQAHTIDPRSGRPIANDLASVTVVHPQCMAADAWSTALTVLGGAAGMQLAERQGLAARFVLRGADGAFTEHLTAPLRGMLDE